MKLVTAQYTVVLCACSGCAVQCVEDLSALYDNVVGDVVLSSAVVAYLGPYVLSFRQVSCPTSTTYPYCTSCGSMPRHATLALSPALLMCVVRMC